jgi:hypothetical protein
MGASFQLIAGYRPIGFALDNLADIGDRHLIDAAHLRHQKQKTDLI